MILDAKFKPKVSYYSIPKSVISGKVILSYGGGVNTFALLLKRQEWGIKLNHVVFADTGNEKPQTYEHMRRYQIPEIERQGLKLTVVRHPKWNSLLEYTLAKRKMPFRKTNMARYCTGMFKLDPIIRFETSIRQGKEPFVNIIGIAYDEIHRMSTVGRRKWITNAHPLIDHHITRQDCKGIIQNAGYPIPPKSGCDFCPFQRKSEWARTARDNPSAIDDGIMIETLFNEKLKEQRAAKGEVQRTFMTLRADEVPLEKWRKEKATEEIRAITKLEADEALQSVLDEECDMESCMT